jgi:hypothetical protein
MMGGLGICVREFCCHSFLGDFAQVTIKMAKEQNLSLNAAKISDACGKLMCCLRYEYEAYLQEAALTPKVDSRVTTPDGPGVVVSTDPMRSICNVRLDKATDQAPSPYHRDLLNRPENPTSAPVVLTDKSEKTDKPARADASPRNERPARRTPPVASPTLEPTPDEPTKEITDTPQQTAIEAGENTDRNAARKGGRHGGHKGRGDNRKKGDHKDNAPNVAEAKRPSKAGDTNVENKQSVPAPKPDKDKEKNERKDHSPKKHNRPQPNEKKTDNKFDVKFGGGELPTESKSEERHEPRHNNHGRHHHRGGKKNEKKTQKTENNN